MSWRLHVNASTPEKAQKVAARVAARVDHRLEVARIEPYWKIEGQQIVSCAVDLRAKSFPQAVVEALVIAGEVAHGWHVNAPEESADGWHFDGWASGNFRVAGIDFASWTLSPLPEKPPEAA